MFQKSIKVYRNGFYVSMALLAYIFLSYLMLETCYKDEKSFIYLNKLYTELPKECFFKRYSSRLTSTFIDHNFAYHLEMLILLQFLYQYYKTKKKHLLLCFGNLKLLEMK
uniref:Uncharacterized protein n=1 Tax=Strongyloides stercoralis TaxID=6248 RepID=A0A0K0EBM1_STRER